MTRRDDRILLEDMLTAARTAFNASNGKSISYLEEEPVVTLGLVKCLEIIGEAASRLSGEFKATYHEVLWETMVGMRNRLVHAYFDIDNEQVWKTITTVSNVSRAEAPATQRVSARTEARDGQWAVDSGQWGCAMTEVGDGLGIFVSAKAGACDGQVLWRKDRGLRGTVSWNACACWDLLYFCPSPTIRGGLGSLTMPSPSLVHRRVPRRPSWPGGVCLRRLAIVLGTLPTSFRDFGDGVGI